MTLPPTITSRVKDRLYRRQPVFSFEFFPPKTRKGEKALFKVLEGLAPMNPAFVSVTYGAGGSTRDKTEKIVCSMQRDYGLTTMAHLTCIGHTHDEIRHLLDDYAEAGIRDLLALRGDPPKEEADWATVSNGPQHAIDLIHLVNEVGDFTLAVAGFPEKHPESETLDCDLEYLQAKVNAGAELVITQLFFDNDTYFDYVRRARKVGVTVPIIPGIMPIVLPGQIERFVQLSGCRIPTQLKRHIDACGDDAARVSEIGLAYCASQCVDLLRRGAPGVHFYTLNKSRATQTIFAALQSMGFWEV